MPSSFDPFTPAAGIGDTVNRLTDAIAQWGEKRKNDAKETKAYRALAGVYDPANKDKYEAMGLDDLRAAATAHAAQVLQGQQQQQSKLQELAIAREQRVAEGDTATQALLAQAGQANGVPGTNISDDAAPEDVAANMQGNGTGQFSVADVLSRLPQNPAALRNPAIARLLEEQTRTGSQLPYKPEEFEAGGIKGIVSPRTGSIHTTQNPSGLKFEERLQLLDRKGLLDERRSLISARAVAFTPEDKQYYQTQLDAIDARLKPASPERGKAEGASAPTANEVTRITADGRTAIFDGKTKKFLRYAE